MLALSLSLGMPGGASGPPPTPAAPVNTSAPVISGIQTQGQTLSASQGGWSGYPSPSFGYQWKRAGSAITGATSATYVLQAADVGSAITCTVTATNSQGAASATSSATGTIAATLTISGTPATTGNAGSAYSFTPSTAGGHTPKTFSITNKPSWAAFSTSTGQLTGTPSGSETDTGIVISVTDTDGLTASLASFDIVVSATPTTYAAPYYDDFSGTAGTITNRNVPVGSPTATWTFVTGGQTTVANPLQVDGTTGGHLNGNFGSGSPANTVLQLDTGTSNRKWYNLEMNCNPTGTPWFQSNSVGNGIFCIDAAYRGSADLWDRFTYYSKADDLLQFAYGVNVTLGNGAITELLHTNTDSAGRGVTPRAGDVWAIRKYVSAAHTFYEPYYNGQQIGPAMDVTSLGITITDKFALRGDIPNQKQYDGTMVGDPDSHAMVSVYAPRVMQKNADGSFTLYLQGDYTKGAPSGLTVTLFSPADDSSFAGYVNVPVTSFTTGAAKTLSSDGSWTGKLAVAASVVTATVGAYVRVYRSDITGGGTVNGRSGVFYPGDVSLLYGQSLAVKSWSNSQSGLTYTAPSQSFVVDGAIDNDGTSSTFPITAVNRKTRQSKGSLQSGLATSVAQARAVAWMGADTGMAYIRSGYSGTYYAQRQPTALDPSGSGIWAAMLDGLRLAGNDLGYVYDIGGEFESVGAASAVGSGYQLVAFGSTEQATLISQIQATYDALDALIAPRTVKVILSPVGAIFTGSDVRCEVMRRLQWKLTQDYPSRYILGSFKLELQHSSSADQYHLTGNGFAENLRRMEAARLKSQGVLSFDRTGPKLVSVTAHSDTSVTVKFDKNGASALEIVNTVAAITDYRGGLTFATDSAFSSQKVPTAVSAPTDIDATYASLTWTFAAGSFGTGAVFVRGPYGFNPFNRTNNATINTTPATNASMVRGVFTGEDYNIPVQPYWSASGDYITA